MHTWAIANGYGPCCVGLTTEHIISKGMLVGGKTKYGKKRRRERLRLVEKVYPHLFLGEVCLNHNSTTKCADTTEARRYLLKKRWDEYGDEFEDAVAELATTFKSPPEYLRLEFLRA